MFDATQAVYRQREAVVPTPAVHFLQKDVLKDRQLWWIHRNQTRKQYYQ